MGACRTILIVENEESIREPLRDFLEFEGYSVLTAANGKEAFSCLKSTEKPILILLDLMMPIMGGLEFLGLIQKDVSLAPIPVIIVSSDHPGDAKGYHAYIKKPVDLDALLKTIKKFCKED